MKKLCIITFVSVLIIVGCTPWSDYFYNSSNSFKVKYRLSFNTEYTYHDFSGLATTYFAEPGYLFCDIDMNISLIKENVPSEVVYSLIELRVKERYSDDDVLVFSPCAVDCGFLCAHEILSINSDSELDGLFSLDGIDDNKSIGIVYIVPYWVGNEGIIDGININGEKLNNSTDQIEKEFKENPKIEAKGIPVEVATDQPATPIKVALSDITKPSVIEQHIPTNKDNPNGKHNEEIVTPYGQIIKDIPVKTKNEEIVEKSGLLNKSGAIKWQLSRFNQGLNKSKSLTDTYPILDKIADTLLINSDEIVELRSYTDNAGASEYNRRLSQKNAEVIKNYLVSRGVESNRILPLGYGESNPIADNNNAEGRGLNNRIEFYLSQQPGIDKEITSEQIKVLNFNKGANEKSRVDTLGILTSGPNVTAGLNNINNNISIIGAFKSVKIGGQIWMSENLNVDKFRNGELIPEAKTFDEWSDAEEDEEPAWCYYENDPINGGRYGKLYNWFAIIDERGLAPEGWHIPSRVEFENLISIVSELNGNALKAIGQGASDGLGTNTTGFTALLAGYRDYRGPFRDLHHSAFFWGSTEFFASTSCDLRLFYENSYLLSGNNIWGSGLSVRCIKD
ncbi:MAG: OmpA family protein [Melioribacteraceae bacterium]|nr:OmpA family protein [Melioribacteraceae bacterium]